MTARNPPAPRVAGERQLRTASYAVFLTFVGAGFSFANWAARIPQIRAVLQVSPGVLGLILLSGAIGSGIATPLSGLVITWLGEVRTVAWMSLLSAGGLAIIAAGYRAGIAPVAVGLFLFGFGGGSWDVAMNVQGAAVEQGLGRSVMPRFHAGWSVGTVAGAGTGAAMVALNVPVVTHLLAVALIVAAAVPAATRGYLRRARQRAAGPAVAGAAPLADRGAAEWNPVDQGAAGGSATAGRRSALAAWLEPRTLLIGVFVLCMTVTEGAGNDWLSLAVIDGYRVAAVVGTLTFAIFLAGMTVGRWVGPRFIDAYGRVRALRACTVIALAGLLLIDFGPFLPAAMAGALLMGLGTSLGFPVGLSAAADD
ncbi:MAG: MFS transporter, partial [Actinobacteria bacterium]|nr:MFS transporter [Actinomycetota bacterium]